jgi:tetratricopeptide (TPR) repeat protein
MSRKSRNRSQAKPAKPAKPTTRRARLLLALLALVLVSAGLVLVLARPVPTPPNLKTSGLDPAIAGLIESSTRDVRNRPRSGAAWGRLATVLLHAQFQTEANFAFQQAERFSPRDARWPYLHGMLLREDQRDTALKLFEQASRLCGNQPDAPRLRLAQLLLERGRFNEAETHFQELLKSEPSHPPALLGLARIRLAQDRAAESTDLLGRCLDSPHVARSAQALLAQVRRRQGDPAGAATAARQATALPPDRPWPDPYWSEALQLRVGKTARLEQAQSLIDLGRSAEALKALTSLERDYPDDPEAYYLAGWVLNREGRGADAERNLREHLRRSPDSPKGHAQLAVAFLAQERYAEAADVLRKGIELKPTWAELHFNLGYACAHLGRNDEAIARFRETLRLDANYVDACITLADLLTRRGEREEALALLRQALQLNPADERASFLLKRIE